MLVPPNSGMQSCMHHVTHRRCLRLISTLPCSLFPLLSPCRPPPAAIAIAGSDALLKIARSVSQEAESILAADTLSRMSNFIGRAEIRAENALAALHMAFTTVNELCTALQAF